MTPRSANEHLGLLFLRIGVGGLMIFHGFHKLITENGHQGVQDLLASKGLPTWLWLGVPVGEVIAPLLILIGVATRLSSALVAVTMAVSIYLAFGAGGFSIDGSTGGLVAELNLLFFFGSLALLCLGAGQYSAYTGANKWLK